MSNHQLSLGLGFVVVTFPLSFRHAGQLPNDIVLCIIVFVFCGGKLQNTVRTGAESTTQATGGRGRRVLMQCSTSAPDDGYTAATEAPLATENRDKPPV